MAFKDLLADAGNWIYKRYQDLTGQSVALENADQTNSMNYKIAQETNAQNKAIADQNFALQQDWNEYQKALQQQIFEREDTAYQRTAKDMLAAGLNPLSMQGTNGAGQVVSTNAPQNNYQAQQSSPMQQASVAMTSLDGLMSGITNIFSHIEAMRTGKLERDQLQQQIDYQKLINNALSRELNHKIDIDSYDTDMLPEKIITHLMDWTKNGRAGKVFNFGLQDLFDIFKPGEDTNIPLINDLKDLIYGTENTKSLGEKLFEQQEAERKARAAKKSQTISKNSHYKTKNEEYKQRYGGK